MYLNGSPICIISIHPQLISPCPLSLLLQAGMVEEMNEFASRFMSETEQREEIISQASAVADTHQDPK